VNAVRPCCRPDLPARTLVVLLAVTIGVGVPAGGARAALPRLEPCSTVPDAVCGHVLVPLDRSRPDGDRVAIGFAVYRHADESRPAEGTIFVTNGGPGGSATQAGRDYALSIYGALLDRRDLVLIDYRGEGLSAPIDCPWLQRGAIDLYAAFAACGERLGPRADLYGSADVAEDVEAVRAALGVDRFDYHGGSYAGADVQAYAVRHPGRLRSVVLDSPVAATGFDPWWTSRVTASARVVTRLCRRSRTCRRDHPHAAADLAWLARRLHRQPVDGTAADALGEAHDLHVDEAALAELAQLDTGGFSAQTELAAAAGSLRRGDALPLLRLAAEGDRPFRDTAGGPDRTLFSSGLNAARPCTDRRFQWDPAAPFRMRLRQYEAARAALSPRRFAPFSVAAWTASPPQGQQPDPCIRWPAPSHRIAPGVPAGVTVRGVPALVLSGDLDTDVATEESLKVRRVFPAARVVHVLGSGHLTAAGFDGPCVQRVIRRFVVHLSPGSTGCTRTPAFAYPAVGRFPRTAAEARPASAIPGAGDESAASDRRIAATVVATVVDGIRRALIADAPNAHGRGLRGGVVRSDSDPSGPLVEMRGDRFAGDVAVSGHARVDLATGALVADVALSSPTVDGKVHVGGVLFRPGHHGLRVDGSIDGRRVVAGVPAG
jgi:pimeloyl-ACP methyl ester carboxylesterase